MSQPDTDEALVALAQQGEVRAFETLVERYSPKIYGLVYHMTSHHEDARELVQDTFAKAHRSIAKFRGSSSFYTWLYTIAHNTTLNFIKRNEKRKAWSLDDVDSGIQNDPAFVDQRHVANPRAQVGIHELQQKLNEAVQSLSEDHRAVVVMFDIQGMPHAEISKILDVSEGTVRSRLYYAHQLLQAKLSDYLQQ